jgi:hypothetical protein
VTADVYAVELPFIVPVFKVLLILLFNWTVPQRNLAQKDFAVSVFGNGSFPSRMPSAGCKAVYVENSCVLCSRRLKLRCIRLEINLVM